MLMRCQIRAITASPDPSDTFVNVWYLNAPGATNLAVLADAAVPRFNQFYQALQGNMSDFTQSYEARFYNMSDPPPRVPEIRDLGVTPGHDPVQGNLPEELAVVLTFHGAPPVTRRRRGRLYIGPLCTTALASAPEQAVRVSTTLINAITQRAATFAQSVAGGTWVVYSPTASESTGITVSTDVVGGWVDNAFDVQRRRGPDATSRTTWTP